MPERQWIRHRGRLLVNKFARQRRSIIIMDRHLCNVMNYFRAKSGRGSLGLIRVDTQQTVPRTFVPARVIRSLATTCATLISFRTFPRR